VIENVDHLALHNRPIRLLNSEMPTFFHVIAAVALDPVLRFVSVPEPLHLFA